MLGEKASFRFSTQLTAGISDGKLQFNYKDADIDPKSAGIDWVVIAANELTFQGKATINDHGEYTFRVSATDISRLGKNQDIFNITIWQGTTIENNDPIHTAQNVISVGNIIVNKK